MRFKTATKALCGTAAFLLAATSGLQAQSITNGLSAYFNFDNNINAQANTHLPASLYKGTPRYATGVLGQAASFQNDQGGGQPSDWALTLGNIESVYTNDFSISLWVKTRSGDGAWIGNKDWTSGGNIGYCLDSYYDSFLDFNVIDGSRVDMGAIVRDGNWHHVAVTFDRVNNLVTTFVDGVNAAQSPIGPSGAESLNAGFPTLIGASGPGVYAGKADLDDLGIWSRAISGDEVTSIYSSGLNGINLLGNKATALYLAKSPQPAACFEQEYLSLSVIGGGGSGAYSYQWVRNGSAIAGATNSSLAFAPASLASAGNYQVILSDASGSVTSAPVALTVLSTSDITSGLIGHWAFDESSGTTAADQSSYAKAANLNGFAGDSTTWGAGEIKKALKFGGAAAYQYANVDGFTQATNRLTISAWVWADAADDRACIVDNYGQNALGQFRFGVSSASTRPLNAIIKQQSGNTVTVTDSATLPLASWQHVAVVADGASVRLYRNGIQVASAAYDGTLINPSGIQNMFIGARIADDGVSINSTPGFWTGAIDDLGLWTRGLSSAEILSIYSQGLKGKDLTSASGQTVIKPTLSSQPSSLTLFTGRRASFSVTAAGTAPLAYQWYKDNAVLTGATNSTLVIAQVATSNAGNYIVVVTNTAGAVTSAPPAVLTVNAVTNVQSGLAVYLPFDNDITAHAGTTIDGTAIGNDPTPKFTNGVTGSAALFSNDGSSGSSVDWSVSLGDIEWIYSGSWSFSMWVNATANNDGALLGNKDWYSGGNVGWLFDPSRLNGLNYTGVGSSRHDIGTANVLDGKWHLITAVFDRDSNQVNYYVDSVLNATASLGTSGLESLTPTTFSPNATLVGSSGNDTWAGQGAVDDLAIWDRPITTDEILGIYAQGLQGKPLTSVIPGQAVKPVISTQPVGATLAAGFPVVLNVLAGGSQPLVFQWFKGATSLAGATNSALNFPAVAATDAGSYTVVISNRFGSVTSSPALLQVTAKPAHVSDGLTVYLNFDENTLGQAGTTYDGTPIGNVGTPRYVTGIAGSAASFNNDGGSGPFASDWAVSLGDIEWVYDTNWSCSIWIRTTDTLGAFIGNKDWNSGGNIGWLISEYLNGFLNYHADGGSRHDLGPSTSWADGQWHHIAVVFYRDINTVYTYVDGKLAATASLGVTGFESLTPVNISTTLVGGSGTGAYSASGDVDELGIWTRPLSPEDVTDLYAVGLAGDKLTNAGQAPLKLNASISGGNVVLTFPAWAASTYKLYSTSAVKGAAWTLVSTTPVVGTDTATVTLPLGTQSTLFFRLQK